jgi:molybdopterin adenylyltransferase
MSSGNIDETRAFIPVRIAVLTISDTRTLESDKSGDILAERIKAAGHELADRTIVQDDQMMIAEQVRRWLAERTVDVVITTGGTGLTGRDVTVEAIKPLFEKEIDGFSALFHQLSFAKIGTSTVQSRACAGVASGTFIFCLPGSPGAVKDGWDGILKLQLDARHQPCNFVEIMPRLQEHVAAEQRKR